MDSVSFVQSSADRRIVVEREVLRRLSRRAPWRLLAQTAFEWICILALGWSAHQVAHPAAVLLNVLLIATRQHALLALMHEYSHSQLSRRHPKLNDLIGDIFTAFPFFITVFGFRRNHMAHHRHTSTAHDPNWMSSLRKRRYQFPMSRTRYLMEVFKHCVGFYTAMELKGYTIDSGMALKLPKEVRIARTVYVLAAVGVIAWLGWWREVLLYWLAPMSTFLMAILYVRDVGEHFGMGPGGIAQSRTVVTNWLERLLISQNNVHFHIEHHLFPGVPFFRLGELHRALMSDPVYLDRATLSKGYFGQLLDEICMAGPLKERDSNIFRRGRMETRYLRAYDVPALMELEKSKWEPNQAAEAQALLERIHAFPTLCIGCFCLDTGKALASLFMRPVTPAIFTAPTRWEHTANAVALPPLEGATTRSLFGISLSSNSAEAVDEIFRFFYPRALKAGWHDIFLGSPIPGFAKALHESRHLSVWRYVHAKRKLNPREPLDPQLRYYFRKGFRQIVSIQEDYFPHQKSLNHGVILRGCLPFSRPYWLWRVVPSSVVNQLASLMMKLAS